MISLRASKMPLAFRCGGSVVEPSIRIEESSEPARLGTAVHVALRPLAEGGSVDWGSLLALADEHECIGDELRMLCAMATKLWPQLEATFVNALTEVELSAEVPGHDLILTGHADMLSIAGSSACGGDWKSGRRDADYRQQMLCYCALALLNDSRLDAASFTLVWIRSGEVETHSMTRAQLPDWLAAVRAQVVDWDGVYHPGEWCGYCPRSHECPARAAMVRREVAAFLDTTVMSEALVPAAMLSMHRRAKTVKKVAEDVLAMIKAHVEAHGELVDNGAVLSITETPTRELDVAKSWPVLERAGFGDDDFASAIRLSVTKVEKRIAQKAGRGNGKAAVAALGEELEAAGAVTYDVKRTLEEKRRT